MYIVKQYNSQLYTRGLSSEVSCVFNIRFSPLGLTLGGLIDSFISGLVSWNEVLKRKNKPASVIMIHHERTHDLALNCPSTLHCAHTHTHTLEGGGGRNGMFVLPTPLFNPTFLFCT